MSPREQWIAILDAASTTRPSDLNEEWEWLMDELGVRLDLFPAVLNALSQQRWREAKSPRAYLKTVAKREARRMGLLETHDSELVVVNASVGFEGATETQEETLERVAYQLESGGPFKSGDGVWRSGGSGYSE